MFSKLFPISSVICAWFARVCLRILCLTLGILWFGGLCWVLLCWSDCCWPLPPPPRAPAAPAAPALRSPGPCKLAVYCWVVQAWRKLCWGAWELIAVCSCIRWIWSWVWWNPCGGGLEWWKNPGTLLLLLLLHMQQLQQHNEMILVWHCTNCHDYDDQTHECQECIQLEPDTDDSLVVGVIDLLLPVWEDGDDMRM